MLTPERCTCHRPGQQLIADHLLGGNKLLGMSFLDRFQFQFDDPNNEMILMAD